MSIGELDNAQDTPTGTLAYKVLAAVTCVQGRVAGQPSADLSQGVAASQASALASNLALRSAILASGVRDGLARACRLGDVGASYGDGVGDLTFCFRDFLLKDSDCLSWAASGVSGCMAPGLTVATAAANWFCPTLHTYTYMMLR